MPAALTASTPAALPAPSPELLRVGIIGFGKMGRIRYETVHEGDQARVVAIADTLHGQEPEGIRCYRSGEELLRDRQVDAVFIATPNCLNKPLTIAALRAGKHVFCEKPPALCAADVEEVMAVEKKLGDRKLMYGFNHRHHDSVKEAKALVDSGVYGRILWMRGRYGKSVDESFYSDWRSKKELAGGGIFIDQGIHMLDLFLMFAGDFDEVHAFVSSLYWKLGVEDNVFAIYRNRMGLVASLHSTMTQWRHLFSLEIFLERGYIVINGLLTSSGAYGEEVMTVAKNRTPTPAATWSDEEHFQFNTNTSWASEAEHFFQAIQKDQPVRIGGSAEALKLMRLVDKTYQNGGG